MGNSWYLMVCLPWLLDGMACQNLFFRWGNLVGDVLKGQEVGIVEDHLGPLRRQIQGVTPHGDA